MTSSKHGQALGSSFIVQRSRPANSMGSASTQSRPRSQNQIFGDCLTIASNSDFRPIHMRKSCGEAAPITFYQDCAFRCYGNPFRNERQRNMGDTHPREIHRAGNPWYSRPPSPHSSVDSSKTSTAPREIFPRDARDSGDGDPTLNPNRIRLPRSPAGGTE